MFVLAPVSSMKTRRSALSQVCHWLQRLRLYATSGRSCSAARWVFFIAVPQRAQRGVDRLLRDIDALASEPSLKLGQRDVRLRRHHRMQPVLPTGELALLLTPDPARLKTPRLAPAPNQIDRTRRTTAKRRPAARADAPAFTASMILERSAKG